MAKVKDQLLDAIGATPKDHPHYDAAIAVLANGKADDMREALAKLTEGGDPSNPIVRIQQADAIEDVTALMQEHSDNPAVVEAAGERLAALAQQNANPTPAPAKPKIKAGFTRPTGENSAPMYVVPDADGDATKHRITVGRQNVLLYGKATADGSVPAVGDSRYGYPKAWKPIPVDVLDAILAMSDDDRDSLLTFARERAGNKYGTVRDAD